MHRYAGDFGAGKIILITFSASAGSGIYPFERIPECVRNGRPSEYHTDLPLIVCRGKEVVARYDSYVVIDQNPGMCPFSKANRAIDTLDQSFKSILVFRSPAICLGIPTGYEDKLKSRDWISPSQPIQLSTTVVGAPRGTTVEFVTTHQKSLRGVHKSFAENFSVTLIVNYAYLRNCGVIARYRGWILLGKT